MLYAPKQVMKYDCTRQDISELVSKLSHVIVANAMDIKITKLELRYNNAKL